MIINISKVDNGRLMNLKKAKLLIPYALDIKQNDAEMSLSDHLEELRQRAFWSVSTIVTAILISIFSVKSIVKILQEPALGIKFLQFAPGEYFFASIKIAAYTGLLLSSPFLYIKSYYLYYQG